MLIFQRTSSDSEDVLWKVRTKYQNFNQILHLLVLFRISIKLLVILFVINNARNNIFKSVIILYGYGKLHNSSKTEEVYEDIAKDVKTKFDTSCYKVENLFR